MASFRANNQRRPSRAWRPSPASPGRNAPRRRPLPPGARRGPGQARERLARTVCALRHLADQYPGLSFARPPTLRTSSTGEPGTATPGPRPPARRRPHAAASRLRPRPDRPGAARGQLLAAGTPGTTCGLRRPARPAPGGSRRRPHHRAARRPAALRRPPGDRLPAGTGGGAGRARPAAAAAPKARSGPGRTPPQDPPRRPRRRSRRAPPTRASSSRPPTRSGSWSAQQPATTPAT